MTVDIVHTGFINYIHHLHTNEGSLNMNSNAFLSNILRFLLPAAILTASLLLYVSYRRDIQNLYNKLDNIERQVVSTDCGPIEVAIRGEGEPVLVSHGIGGGFDQGLGLVKAYLGDGYKVIAPLPFWISCHASARGRHAYQPI